jgi:transcriptional regulator with XRE-family HTH domain
MARTPRFSSEAFGSTVVRLMSESGATYRSLSHDAGLSAGYLNHIIHGNRPVPSDDVIERIAKALDVKPDHFREYRLRIVTEQLEEMPVTVDRLYKRLTITGSP